MTAGKGRGTDAMVGIRTQQKPAISPIQTPQMVRDTAPPNSPGSSASLDQGSDVSELVGDRDLKQHIWSLPTREDLNRFATRVKKAFKQDIEQLKEDTTQLGIRLEMLEQRVEEALPAITQLRDKCKAQDQQIEALISQLDDYENHSHRSNIRIRELPEATGAKASPRPPQWRLTGHTEPYDPPPSSCNNPRDIICKLHKYTVKDQIMQLMRKCPYFDFDGARLLFYQDLSSRTLMQRRALQPLLESLRTAGITYRWGFPFCLHAGRDGKSAILRTKDDLPRFLSQLNLEPVDFPDWRLTTDIQTVPTPQPWQQARSNRNPRDRKRSSSTAARQEPFAGN